MSCQHPNCSHLIHSICTNHCHWSLCKEHFNEHKTSLLNEFEEVLEDLIKPTDQLANNLQTLQTDFDSIEQKRFNDLNKSYRKELDPIEQQLIEINQFQNQFNKISEDFLQIKINKNLLNQNHFQELDRLLNDIKQYPLKTNSDEKHLCPLQTPTDIRSTPCSTMVTKRFLPIHLKTVHRLRSAQIKEIVYE